MLPPRGELRPRLEGRAAGDAVEPTSQRCGLANRGGLAGEDEEGGLEGILGVSLDT
jgi:hypothetical protein